MRGFVKNSNFNESTTADSDRRILDNLAGAGISSDISLFSNNLRNTSVIKAEDYVFENNKFKIINEFVVPYSNNTVVIYDDNKYVVSNSNLVDSFQLVSQENPNVIFQPTAPFKDIFRNDSVLFENITNLNPQRLQTKPQNRVSSDSFENYDPYTFYPINENIDAIVQSIEMYEYKRNFSVMTDKDVTISTPLTLNGTVVITNTDSEGNPKPGNNFNSEIDPGMFISNGTEKIRAFSDSSQPWEKQAGALVTNSTNTNIKNLIMTDPEINGISVTSITEESIGTSGVYSLPVTINGETYYLLCKKLSN